MLTLTGHGALCVMQGDVVGVVLDADQGEIVFFRNGAEQGRARGIRGRCVWGVECG